MNLDALLALLENLQWVAFNEGVFSLIRPKVKEIGNILYLIIWNSIKLPKMVMEGKNSWVINSHTDQWHRLH